MNESPLPANPHASEVGAFMTLLHRLAKYVPLLLVLAVVDGLVWAVLRFGFMKSITDPKALWDAQMSLWQALFVADGFVGLLLQSGVAIDQLKVSQSQQKTEEFKALSAQIESLKNNKPLIFTERMPAGDYEIKNVGGGLAINVWMLAENGQFISLGSMAEGESRPLPSPPARQLFVAEARPSTGRRFTPCMNAIAPTGDVAHGFLKPESDASLKIDTALSDYLDSEAHLIQRFLSWHPGHAEVRANQSPSNP